MADWQWNGSRWWKCDLHAHTPVSNDYGIEPDQLTPKEWLLNYMRAGIDCVAITDHNTGEWVDSIKNAFTELDSEQPEGFRPIHLFPGVEISAYGGVHLLAILGRNKTTSDIDSLLGAVGFRGTKGSSDEVTTESVINVVNAIVSAGGIAIPAHVDKDKGLFQQSGATLEQTLNCKNIFTMEMVDAQCSKPQLYIDEKLNWAEILGSDAHHSSGNTGPRYPGSHFTWIKMGSPSIEGLRLALLDGALSLRRSDQGNEDPNKHASLVLDSVEISEARYLGRGQPFIIEFNPWLNAIIGSRGTGKSTIIEFLRIALRREGELHKDLKPEFEKYNRVYLDREDDGLLTENTIIRIVYYKDDSRFRVQWNPAGELEPIQQEIDGKWRIAEGEIRQRFPVRIYSQKQIFQLAKTPLALLMVVDEATEVNRRSWDEKWKEEEGRFLSLRAKAREIEASLAEEQRLRGELDDAKRRLAIFEQAGYANVLKSFQERSRQQREVEAWEEDWIGAGKQLRKVAVEIVPDILDKTIFDPASSIDADLHKHVVKVHDRLSEIRKAVEALASQADAVMAEWNKNKNESSWQQDVTTTAQAYQELRANLASEGAGDLAAYGELVQRRQAIEQRLKTLGERKKQVEGIKEQANMRLQQLLKLRQELTASRRKFFDRVLIHNQHVQIQVVPYGARETAENEIRRLLQIESNTYKKDVTGLLGELYGNNDSAETAETLEHNLANFKGKIRKIAMGQHDAEVLADQRFASYAIKSLQPEALDRLDLWFPEDSLDVRYSPTGDGQDFRSIQEGSPGQKTAALLAFLLSYGEEPLILDQPEDDLDNLLIYDLIVTQLREVKLRRQIIVVTHNANIVVNGDAELVAALAARGGETQKKCGSLQERCVRDTICAVMEGGRKAFEQRYRRIALEERHV